MAWYDKWAIMVIAAAIGVGGYNGIPWCKMDVTVWAYWIGAIGTVGAFVGTIWLATSERRKNHLDSVLLARITATDLHIRVRVARTQVEEACDYFRKYNPKNMPNLSEEEYATHYFNAIGSMLSNVRLWDLPELSPLISLPGHSAALLATAGSLITATAHILVNSDQIQGDLKNIAISIKNNWSSLASASVMMSEAEIVLRREGLAVFDPSQ